MKHFDAKQKAQIRDCMARHISRRQKRNRIAVTIGVAFGLAACVAITGQPTGADLAREIGQESIYPGN